MKNALNIKAILKIAGFIVLMTVFGFVMTSCDDNPPEKKEKDIFEGSWTAQIEMNGQFVEETLIAKEGTFRVMGMGHDLYRGTYTVSGNTVTITFTEINTGFLSTQTTDEWTAYDNIPQGTNGIPPKTITGTINGNQLIFPEMGGVTFTKEGGGGGSTPGGSTPGGGAPGGGGTSSGLTLSGLGAYNGKYVIAERPSNPPMTAAAAFEQDNYTTGGQIVNGSVTLSVWEKNQSNTYVPFTRSMNNVAFTVSIYNSPEGTSPIATGTITVTFTNGAASGTVTNIQPVEDGGDPGGNVPNPLLGQWDNTSGGYYKFNGDGNYSYHQIGGTTQSEGTYVIDEDNSTITLTPRGADSTPQILSYSLNGDTLTLDSEEFTRHK